MQLSRRTVLSLVATSALLGAVVGLIAASSARQDHPSPQPKARPLSWPPLAGTHLVLVTDVIDGDTVRLCWLIEDTARLAGLNAPEVHGTDAAAGRAARDWLAARVSEKPTAVTVLGKEKYGRVLVELWDAQGKSLNRALIEAGHARPWDGRGTRP